MLLTQVFSLTVDPSVHACTLCLLIPYITQMAFRTMGTIKLIVLQMQSQALHTTPREHIRSRNIHQSCNPRVHEKRHEHFSSRKHGNSEAGCWSLYFSCCFSPTPIFLSPPTYMRQHSSPRIFHIVHVCTAQRKPGIVLDFSNTFYYAEGRTPVAAALATRILAMFPSVHFHGMYCLWKS